MANKTIRRPNPPAKPPMLANPQMKPNEQELSVMMQMERRKRAAICEQEIGEVLKKHSCVILGVPGFAPDPDGKWRLGVDLKVSARPTVKGQPT